MNFQSFNTLLNENPSSITQIFISDLHLDFIDGENNYLYDAFLVFLDDILLLNNLKKLYILGDWFEAWLGDDIYVSLNDEEKREHWLTAIIDKLTRLRQQGCSTYVMIGNRDFLLQRSFCNTFMGELIKEPYYITLDTGSLDTDNHNTGSKDNALVMRLEHGDALCTDDTSYQRLRRITRNNFVQWWLLKKSIESRKKIAHKMRARSKSSHKNKSMTVMDVNPDTVREVFLKVCDARKYKKMYKKPAHSFKPCNILIHGHTHQPDIYQYQIKNSNDNGENDGKRYVLGDWRVDVLNKRVSAVIGITLSIPTTVQNARHNNTDSFQLCEFSVFL